MTGKASKQKQRARDKGEERPLSCYIIQIVVCGAEQNSEHGGGPGSKKDRGEPERIGYRSYTDVCI